ncbi:MAG: hypothetical protein Q4A56_07425 [Porphyromonadaceae bacterium]|nr:hypothetical protein [Porphyromonadaceae bacterium]
MTKKQAIQLFEEKKVCTVPFGTIAPKFLTAEDITFVVLTILFPYVGTSKTKSLQRDRG